MLRTFVSYKFYTMVGDEMQSLEHLSYFNKTKDYLIFLMFQSTEDWTFWSLVTWKLNKVISFYSNLTVANVWDCEFLKYHSCFDYMKYRTPNIEIFFIYLVKL